MKLRVPLDELAEGLRELSKETATYVARVHRLGLGDGFVVFDPSAALEADATIEGVGKRVLARVGATRPSRRPSREITLLQGLPKADKMDAIVRDATELGATLIVPTRTLRSLVDPSAARGERWRRIAVEAARQSGRGDAPVVAPVASLEEALAAASAGARLALDPRGEKPISDALATFAKSASVVLLVGPEGGLDASELEAAERAGFTRISMGPIVLRTETVCAAVLGALLAQA